MYRESVVAQSFQPVSAAACLSSQTDNSFGKHFTSGVELGVEGLEDDNNQDVRDDDEDDDDDDEAQHEADVEDLFAGGDRLSLKKFGRNRRLASIACVLVPRQNTVGRKNALLHARCTAFLHEHRSWTFMR